MSTANYSYKNKLFVLECEDAEVLDMDRESIIESLTKSFSRDKRITVTEINEHDDDRNYYGHIFAEVRFNNGRWDMRAFLAMRNGYYSGVNVDYCMEEPEYLIESCEQKAEPKYITEMRDIIFDKIEEVLSNHCQELLRVGCFSNGECMYKLKN